MIYRRRAAEPSNAASKCPPLKDQLFVLAAG